MTSLFNNFIRLSQIKNLLAYLKKPEYNQSAHKVIMPIQSW